MHTSHRQLLRQLLRFGIVGVAGFLVNAVLVESLAVVIGPALAQVVAFPVAVTCTWLMNRQFTFSSTEPATFAEWRRYVAANSVGMIANNGCYFLLVLLSQTAHDRPILAVAVGSIAGLFFNFVTTRKYVFKTRNQ